MPAKLYSHWKSSCSWRVRIALALKGVKYEYESVNLYKEEDLKRIENINPFRQIPALTIDNNNFIQSLAIVEFINEKFAGYDLLPKDLNLKTQVRSICEVINSGIQPMQTLPVVYKLPEKERLDWIQYWMKWGFAALEKLLRGTSGKYCVGDDVTAADIFLVPQVSNAIHRFDVDMSEFPIIKRIYSTLECHAAFREAHPFQQPDAPQNATMSLPQRT